MIEYLFKIASPEGLLYAAGIAGLSVWLLRTSLGRRALTDAPVRRTCLHPYFLLVALLVWQVPTELAVALAGPWLKQQTDAHAWFWRNVLMASGSALAAAFFMTLAGLTYAGRLRGLGLGLKRLPGDIGRAAAVLFCVWPVVLAVIALTTQAGRWLHGPAYRIEEHQELKLLAEYPGLSLKVSVAIMAAVMAPFTEELLFRGLFQTTLRSYLGRPWLSIAMTSLLFALFHADPAHWPALFVLSVGIGYAYERSGSLWQAVFIHALFNGVTVASYLV